MDMYSILEFPHHGSTTTSNALKYPLSTFRLDKSLRWNLQNFTHLIGYIRYEMKKSLHYQTLTDVTIIESIVQLTLRASLSSFIQQLMLWETGLARGFLKEEDFSTWTSKILEPSGQVSAKVRQSLRAIESLVIDTSREKHSTSPRSVTFPQSEWAKICKKHGIHYGRSEKV